MVAEVDHAAGEPAFVQELEAEPGPVGEEGAPEDGWVALHSAPVEVIAVVDRSKGKTASGNAVNAS